MLYVFHVDAGQMTTYDMSLTLQNVICLKSAIERKTKISANSLVLLVSGGEVLQGDHMVSSYSAGTDTNPIYMFCKPTAKDTALRQSNQYSVCDLSPIVELSTEQWRSETRGGVEVKSVDELKAAVDMCCTLPPSVSTVATCATLAQQFSEHAREIAKNCEQMVLDQHLQHLGWAAVVANLEDIYNEFCDRSKNFKESFKKHRQKKEQYHRKLDTLGDVLDHLGKMPIPPALRLNAAAHRFSAFDVFEETDFDANYGKISAPLDNSSENKGYQDFGVEAFKLSEEDVFNAGKQDSDEAVTFKARSYETNKEEPTLLQWILAQGNRASLQDILDYCHKGLALIDADPLKEREAELYHILEYANMHGLKQIKGIEDRLYGLDQLLNEVKKLEKDQHDQAASLIQNRERVSTVCDPSVLPTLVQSHRYQLEKLMKNHQLLVDIHRRIAKSKEELSHILKARLEAVLTIENSMSVQDAHQMLSFQCFNRLARYFDIVDQLHEAPAIFVHAVHEVARRRTFSDAFLTWATSLSSHLLEIHNEEVARRHEFNTLFHGHFLKSLFPGLNDLPPAYGAQTPPVFDGRVPKLTGEDVATIAQAFPELAEIVPKYDMETTVKFFKQRAVITDYEEKQIEVQIDLNNAANSETGTFEQLTEQSALEKQKVDISTTCVPETMAVSTVTEVRILDVIEEVDIQDDDPVEWPKDRKEESVESPRGQFVDSQFYIDESLPSSMEWGRDAQDNMDTHKINITKLREFFHKLYELCKGNILLINGELLQLKNQIDEQKKYIASQHLLIVEALQRSKEDVAIRFREQAQRLTVDHELELADLRNDLKAKDDVISNLERDKENIKQEYNKEIESLKADNQKTLVSLEKNQEEIRNLQKKIEDADVQKQKEMKELQEKMHQDYKAEIESLRSRFRLVALTNMDRSPSESSLEKIERTDVIEITSHNAIVMQTKENAEMEKEEAVRLATEQVTQMWEKRMQDEINDLKSKHEVYREVAIRDVTKRLLSEKDKSLSLMRERETNLMRECNKFKETIQQLTDPDTNEPSSLLRIKVKVLENEKLALEQQLKELSKEAEKRTSDSSKSREDDSEGRTSSSKKEEGRRARARYHTPYGLQAGTLSLSSCLPGHCVLVLWDPAHCNYTVMQEANIMYFVNSDCLPALDLSIHVKRESERKLYAIAIVESKEYCYAKKSGNRFHMPVGSRFYRVRVKPLKTPVPPCCEHKHKTQDYLKGKAPALAALCDQRPVKKWLTYMHAPDSQKSVETSQPSSSRAEEAGEVATAPLINLESPVSAPADSCEVDGTSTQEHHDSIEAYWNTVLPKTKDISASVVSEMECSVGRVAGSEMELPTELTVSSVSVIAGPLDDAAAAVAAAASDSELAEEATP